MFLSQPEQALMSHHRLPASGKRKWRAAARHRESVSRVEDYQSE
jgi:hypothetical protein